MSAVDAGCRGRNWMGVDYSAESRRRPRRCWADSKRSDGVGRWLVQLAHVIIAASLVGTSQPTRVDLLRLIQKHAASLLAGYRLPSQRDIQDDWAWVRAAEHRLPYRVSADFNGDGRLDHAFILLSRAAYRIRVCALVSTGDTYVGVQVLEVDAETTYGQHRYVVSEVLPGEYEEMEGPTFRLVNSAISVVYTESSEAFFIWDGTKGAFRRVGISD